MTAIDRPRLVLASASPARLATLRAAGIDAEVILSGVDESTVDADRPDVLCRALATLKAEAVAARLRTLDSTPSHAPPQPASAAEGNRGRLVLGCDSVLGMDGRTYGKPRDAADATARWRLMRGRSGVLHTGHCLIDTATGRRSDAVASTTVYFADVTDGEIAAYVATGEPLVVAGAFTLDGLGGPFVERIDGDPSNVVGLSLPLLRRLLRGFDVELTTLWR